MTKAHSFCNFWMRVSNLTFTLTQAGMEHLIWKDFAWICYKDDFFTIMQMEFVCIFK